MANNSSNLRPPTSEEARERGRKGGKASAKRRQELKAFKEVLEKDMSYLDQKAMIAAQILKARRGYLPSFELILKMRGEHPDQQKDSLKDNDLKVEMAGTDEYDA